MSVRARGKSSDAMQRRRDLDYYIHDSSHALRFELAGWLSKDTTSDLKQAWRTTSSMIGERRVVFDLSRLVGIDGSGQEVLAEWSCRGALLGVTSHHARERLQSMTNQPVAVLASAAAGPRWRPLRAIPSWLAALLGRTDSRLAQGPDGHTEDACVLCSPMKVSAPAARVLPQKPSIAGCV
jgi:ABC-type transporter Mla MlaB component